MYAPLREGKTRPRHTVHDYRGVATAARIRYHPGDFKAQVRAIRTNLNALQLSLLRQEFVSMASLAAY